MGMRRNTWKRWKNLAQPMPFVLKKANLRYNYFFPANDPETLLLIDSWENQEAIDAHHASPMMTTLAALRDKYDLHMTVERYLSDNSDVDSEFIRK